MGTRIDYVGTIKARQASKELGKDLRISYRTLIWEILLIGGHIIETAYKANDAILKITNPKNRQHDPIERARRRMMMYVRQTESSMLPITYAPADYVKDYVYKFSQLMQKKEESAFNAVNKVCRLKKVDNPEIVARIIMTMRLTEILVEFYKIRMGAFEAYAGRRIPSDSKLLIGNFKLAYKSFADLLTLVDKTIPEGDEAESVEAVDKTFEALWKEYMNRENYEKAGYYAHTENLELVDRVAKANPSHVDVEKFSVERR